MRSTPQQGVPSERVPRATYRLQFNSHFTLHHAVELVPYLSELGISHVYASPLLKARPGSAHGYDVCDPSQINPEVGTEAELSALVSALHEHGMGLVLDIVPNHAGIGPENAWWWDVLKHGQSSSFADYFDIEWDSLEPEESGKLLLPVLQDSCARVLERGELRVERDGNEVTLRYREQRFPVDPASLPPVAESRPQFVEELNSNPAKLTAFLCRQHYLLRNWHDADGCVNYRRFFAVNTLAALRVEEPKVFRATHERILDWWQRGHLDGLRVDHPDGLRDPLQYLERLRAAAPTCWILVEKILQPGEELPDDWPVAGTTGYEFLNRVTGLYTDPAGEALLAEFYAEFTGEPVDWASIVREKKLMVIRELFGAEVGRLVRLLERIVVERRLDFPRDRLRAAVIELAAALPVYRCYERPPTDCGAGCDCAASRVSSSQTVGMSPSSSPPESDVAADYVSAPHPGLRAGRALDFAISIACQHRAELRSVFEFLDDLLRLRTVGPAETEFVLRFQQLTGPAMAKGVEDTAFYCFNRFVALNEVGGDPGRFGAGVLEFHQDCRRAQERWPGCMLATSTHDTKRGEEVRARLVLLSEIPREWAEAVRRWSALNERYRHNFRPDRNAEYLFYQTLVGAWPLPVDRALAYMQKASCEAGQHTRWQYRNGDYEAALRRFVSGALANATFRHELEVFVTPLIDLGRVNSLAQTLLKLTAPGVPDIYQGTELWNLSLVDPDNRRPVDFARRRQLLRAGKYSSPEEIWRRGAGGLPKQWLIRRTLSFRAQRPELFGAGSSYEPLAALGAKAAHAVAFTRGGEAIIIVPRLVLGLRGSWDDTAVPVPPGLWENQLTGDIVPGGYVPLRELLHRFPVALLSRIHD